MTAGAGTRLRRGSPSSFFAVGVVVVAIAAPLAAVLWRAVHVDGSLTADALSRVLGSARTWRVLAVTVGQAAVSAVLTLAIGVPVAWVLARRRFRGRGLVRTVATVPFVLPSVVVGAAFASLLGSRGLVDLRGTWWAVFAAHVCFNLAVVVRIVGAAASSVDPDLESAARLAGLAPRQVFRQVGLPGIRSSIWSAGAVVFLFCLTSFGVIVVLGGGWVTTIEVEMWVRATRQFDLPGAAVLSGLQAATVLVALLVAAPAASPRQARATIARTRPVRTNGERLALAASVAAVGVFAVLPLAALVERSLRVAGGYGLQHWSALGQAGGATNLAVDPLASVGASLRAAVPAALAAVLVGVPAAVAVARSPRGLAGRVLLLPLAISATTIGLGLLLVGGRPPLDLRRSPWLVLVAQALVALPLVVRATVPAFSAQPRNVIDSARLAGAGPRRLWWRVQLPMARPAVVAAAGLALIVALGEFGATVFVARTSQPTVPVAIERLLSRPGEAGNGQAMALSVVLACLCAALLWAVDRAGGDRGVSL